MPEGDAVHRLAATFDEVFVGSRVAVSSPQGRFAQGAARLDGTVLARARAVGKHMFLGFVPEEVWDADLEDEARPAGAGVGEGSAAPEGDLGGGAHSWPDLWLHVHLGLYGWWRFNGDSSVVDHGHGVVHRSREGAGRAGPHVSHVPMRWGSGSPSSWAADLEEGTGVAGAGEAVGEWEAPEPVGQVRLRLLAPHAVADLVGPNRCELLSDDEREAAESKLGPDPLAPGAAEDVAARDRFVGAVRKSRRAIGELLMDQSVLAGVGNIYRADLLFMEGISPMRQGQRISRARLEALWVRTCHVMARALAIGRLDTIDPEDAPAEPVPGDEEASRWYVYHRTGRPCLRCGTPVAEKEMQGRRLFWCPSCQR